MDGANKYAYLYEDISAYMLVVDCFLYLGLFLWLDQILPNEYGIKKKPFFFVTDILQYFGSNSLLIIKFIIYLTIFIYFSLVIEENRPV